MYGLQDALPWYSANNSKVSHAERKKVAGTFDKLNRAMLVNQIACVEAFEAKAIKDLKTAISKTM
eukprot:5923462-Lingulodinium_polyedra.AAC.1